MTEAGCKCGGECDRTPPVCRDCGNPLDVPIPMMGGPEDNDLIPDPCRVCEAEAEVKRLREALEQIERRGGVTPGIWGICRAALNPEEDTDGTQGNSEGTTPRVRP